MHLGFGADSSSCPSSSSHCPAIESGFPAWELNTENLHSFETPHESELNQSQTCYDSHHDATVFPLENPYGPVILQQQQQQLQSLQPYVGHPYATITEEQQNSQYVTQGSQHPSSSILQGDHSQTDEYDPPELVAMMKSFGSALRAPEQHDSRSCARISAADTPYVRSAHHENSFSGSISTSYSTSLGGLYKDVDPLLKKFSASGWHNPVSQGKPARLARHHNSSWQEEGGVFSTHSHLGSTFPIHLHWSTRPGSPPNEDPQQETNRDHDSRQSERDSSSNTAPLDTPAVVPCIASLSDEEREEVIVQFWRAVQGGLNEAMNPLTRDLTYDTFLRNVTPDLLQQFRSGSAQEKQSALKALTRTPGAGQHTPKWRQEGIARRVQSMFGFITQSEAARYVKQALRHQTYLRRLLGSTNESVWKAAVLRIPPPPNIDGSPQFSPVVSPLGPTLVEIFENQKIVNSIMPRLRCLWNCDSFTVEVRLRQQYKIQPELVKKLGKKATFSKAEKMLRPSWVQK